jgi:hypothetical protein
MGYKELYDEVNTVKAEVSDLKSDVSAIKLQVSNHLPTALGEIKVTLDAISSDNKQQHEKIESRLIPIETKFTKVSGVSEFLSGIVKVATAIAAVTWTIIQILKVIGHG